MRLRWEDKTRIKVNYPFLLRGASCFTEETLSTSATGRPSPARKKYTKKHMMFSAFIPSLPKGDFPQRKLKDRVFRCLFCG